MKLNTYRVIAAFASAALLGSAALTAELAGLSLAAAIAEGRALAPAFHASVVTYSPVWLGVFTVALIGFSLGLLWVGIPAWLALHGLERRSRGFAVIAGSALSGFAAMILAAVMAGADTPGVALATAVMLAPGAAAGWVLHRIAYGR